MALNFSTIWNGLKLKAKAVLTSDTAGEIEVSSVDNKTYLHNGSTRSPLVTESHTATVSNKSLVDASVTFVDSVDATKQVKIDAAGTTGTSTTILSSQTTNKTLTLPDATDTLVGKATTDILTNKTLVDASTVIADSVDNTRQIKFDASGTTGTSTTITGSQTTNKVITLPDATDTLVGKATIDSLTNKSLVDTSTAIVDSVDPTIQVKINAAGTTGTSTTLLSSQTTNKILTLPNATDTLVGKATTDTLTNKTIDANGTGNSISNLETADLAAGVLNTSITLALASDVQVPSALAVKTYVDNKAAAQNDASEITFTPTGTIAATNVQAAVAEVSGDVTDHLNDTVDAHDASAISSVAAGNLVATDVQAALNELDTEKAKVAGDLAQAFSVLRLEEAAATDATTTGVDASLAAFTQGIIRLTNVSLTSLANIPAGNNGQQLEIFNRTGAPITIKDESGAIGVAANRIFTGSAANITLAVNASLLFAYDSTSSRWQIIGGSGGGAAASAVDNVFNIEDSVDPTKKINFNAAGTTGTKTTITSSQTTNKVITLPDATDTLVGVNTSDVLTNKTISGATNTITNVSLTTGVTGTLPATNGGTGQSTIATGDILYGSAANTLSKLAVGTESKTLRILSGIPAWGEYDPDNLLLNPSFEDSTLANWTCTVGTCTSTNTSGEFSDGLRAMKVALSAQAMNVSQSVSTLAGSTKQYIIGVNYRVPSTMADFQICTLIAGAETTCVPSSKLILDDTYHSIEIPEVITPGSTVGIKFKTTTAYTANAYFDKAYIKQGLGFQNLMLDNVYNAAVTTTSGAIQQGNSSGWIASCTAANPTVCTFKSGLFTVAPNCVVSQYTNNAAVFVLQSLTATTIQIGSYSSTAGTALASQQAGIICQKSGNDYLAASASVYSQASANYDWTSYTPTLTGLGTITNLSCKNRRDGGDLEVNCTFTTGTTNTNTASITLPGSLLVDSARVSNTNLVSATGPVQGYWETIAATGFGPMLTATGTSTSVVYFGAQSAAANSTIAGQGSSIIGNNVNLSLWFKVPIAGWSNSNAIVGSFENVPTTPGVSRVELLSVSYGTGGATTACSANPCSYLDPIGSSVTTMGFNGTGDYTLNFGKTYTKVKCTAIAWAPGVDNMIISNSSSNNLLRCENCNSVRFTTNARATGSVQNSFGNILCHAQL